MIPDAFNGILYEADLEADFKQDDECMFCKGIAIITWNKKYHGWMAECPDCDTQWRCS